MTTLTVYSLNRFKGEHEQLIQKRHLKKQKEAKAYKYISQVSDTISNLPIFLGSLLSVV